MESDSRRREELLLEGKGQPVGGRWNYDSQNRESFGKDGPPDIKAPINRCLLDVGNVLWRVRQLGQTFR